CALSVLVYLVYVNVNVKFQKKIARAAHALKRTSAAQISRTSGAALRAPIAAVSISRRPALRGAGRAALAVELSGLARKRGVDPEKLVEPFLQVRFLPFQQLDLLKAFLAAERQRIGVGIPFLGGDHLADFAQRKAKFLALEDQGKAGPVALRVQAAQPLALRREKALVLVEAQGPQRDAEVARQLADREFNFGGGIHVISSLAGDPNGGRGMLCLEGIIHCEASQHSE